MPSAPGPDIPEGLIPDLSPVDLSAPEFAPPKRTAEDEPLRIRPIFLGLRSRLLQRNIAELDERLEAVSRLPATDTERSAQFIGQAQVTNKGYWAHKEKRRPFTFERNLIARYMGRLLAGRKRNVTRAHTIANLYGAGQSEGFVPDFHANSPNPTFRELRDDSKNSARYRRDMRLAAKRNQRFTDTINPRAAQARRLSTRRHKLDRRLHAIENLRNGRPVDWQEHEPAQVIQPDVIQYGSPDARNKVTIGKELDTAGDELDFSREEHAQDLSRQILLQGEDSSTIYIEGENIYFWKPGAVQGKAKQPDSLSVARVGEIWAGPYDQFAGRIEKILVRHGNVSAAEASASHLASKTDNPFEEARLRAREIDNRVYARKKAERDAAEEHERKIRTAAKKFEAESLARKLESEARRKAGSK